MPSYSLVFTRDYDLPVAIVWDAFVDEDLIDGWLPAGTMRGEVTALEARARLVIESGDDILDFGLTEIPTGTRGSGTTVTVTVLGTGDDTSRVVTAWHTNLERLEELLRGHPVDWEQAAPASGSAGKRSAVNEHAGHDAADRS